MVFATARTYSYRNSNTIGSAIAGFIAAAMCGGIVFFAFTAMNPSGKDDFFPFFASVGFGMPGLFLLAFGFWNLLRYLNERVEVDGNVVRFYDRLGRLRITSPTNEVTMDHAGPEEFVEAHVSGTYSNQRPKPKFIYTAITSAGEFQFRSDISYADELVARFSQRASAVDATPFGVGVVCSVRLPG